MQLIKMLFMGYGELMDRRKLNEYNPDLEMC